MDLAGHRYLSHNPLAHYPTKTTEETDKTTGKVVKTTEEIQSSKTLWDVLQLAGTVAVPVVLAVGGYWLNKREQERVQQREELEQKQAEQREKLEKERAEENLREEVLQAYLDRISELLIDKELGNLTLKDKPARDVARVRTLTVLRRLGKDGQRKEIILRFLGEAALIDLDSPIISLEGADLSGTYPAGANLGGANLSKAILQEANLEEANLCRADLGGTILTGANLWIANLKEADLPSTLPRGL